MTREYESVVMWFVNNVQKNSEHIWYVDISGWMTSCLTETETTRFVHMQNLLPSTLRGCLACLASRIPLLMKHACSLTLRTVGNEKWMKSFWNSVYDYHNTSTIEGVCLSCIVAYNTRGMHYTKTLVPMSYKRGQYLPYTLLFQLILKSCFQLGSPHSNSWSYSLFHFTPPFFLLI